MKSVGPSLAVSVKSSVIHGYQISVIGNKFGQLKGNDRTAVNNLVG
jgi:hypothetical protein